MDLVTKEEVAGLGSSEIVKFSEDAFNFGAMLVYVAALLSCVGSFMFWSVGRSTAAQLNDKRAEKDSVVAEITSPTYKEVEKKASDFKAAYDQIQQAKKDRYSYVQFLPELYKRINKDVKVTTITITRDGQLTVNGTTGSYRAAADQFLALKSWPALTGVKLGAVSLTVGSDGKIALPLALEATIDKTKSPVEEKAEETQPVSSGNIIDGGAAAGSETEAAQ